MPDETTIPLVSPGVNAPPDVAGAALAPARPISPLEAVIKRATGQPMPTDQAGQPSPLAAAGVIPEPTVPTTLDPNNLPPGAEPVLGAAPMTLDPNALPEGATPVPKNMKEVVDLDIQSFNPLTDFDAKGLSDAAMEKAFDPVSLLEMAPEAIRNRPDIQQKVADSFVETWKRTEGNPFAGMTLKGAAKGAVGIGKGLIDWVYETIGSASNAALAEFAGKDAPGIREYAKTQAYQARAASLMAGLQLGLQGKDLAQWVARHAFGRAEQPTSWSKPLQDYTPQDKLDALHAELAKRHMEAKILQGKGAGLVPEGEKLQVPLDPEKIQSMAAGHPAVLAAMGEIMKVPGLLVPEEAAAVAGKLRNAAIEAAPKALGGAARATGATVSAAGKVGEKVAKVAESTAGEYLLAHLLGPPGVILSKGISKAGRALPKAGESISKVGKELTSGIPASDTGALIKGAAEALPDTMAHVLSGAAFDVAMGETTTKSPQEREGLGIGALLGGVGAAKAAGLHTLGTLIAGERAGAFSPGMTQRLHDLLGTGRTHLQFDTEAQAKADFLKKGLTEEDATAKSTDKVGGTFEIGDKKYTYAIGKEATPHEIVHAFKESLPPEEQAALDAKTTKNFSPEEIQASKESYAAALDEKGAREGKSADDILKDSNVLKPGETPDQYTINEIQAENLMTYLKRTGISAKPKTLLGKAGEIVGKTLAAFGVEPLQTQRNQAPGFRVPLKMKEVSGLAGKLREKLTPEAVKAEEARAHEAEKVTHLTEAHPDKADVLKTLSEAQKNQTGVKLTYAAATGEQPSDLSSDLPGIHADARAVVRETERETDLAGRTPWWKHFFPDKTTSTKGGQLQSGGWLPAIFTANAYRLAKNAVKVPAIRDLVSRSYPIDPKSNFFTSDAYDAFQKDVQTAVQNWKDGRTASGVPLQVPENLAKQSGGQIFKPALGPGGGTLEQGKADIISYLMGAKLPETARISGGFPLNVAGQDVSAATMPDRVSLPAGGPRGEFGEAGQTEKTLVTQRAKAKAMGVQGRQLLEVNPFRLQLEAEARKAGVEFPEPVSTYQKLNLERVLHAEHAAGATPELRGNTLTQAAGFEPGKMITPPARSVKVEPERERATTRMTFPKAHEIAKDYAKENGLAEPVSTGNRKYPEELMKKMADALEDLPHSAGQPETQDAYHAFSREILKQAQKIVDAGIDVEPYTGTGEPYKSSEDMIRDVANNKHLYFLKTEKAFGGTSEDQIAAAKYGDNLLLQPSGMTFHGYDASVNDVLRFTHDFFGHTPEGYQFGPQGEFNAFLTHAQMFPKTIQKALMSELLMQTSWFFGNRKLRRANGTLPKRGESDYVPMEKRDFADPKNVIPSDELEAEVFKHVQDIASTGAKFEPATEAGKEAEKRGFVFRLIDHGGGVLDLSLVSPDGTTVSSLTATQKSDKLASVDSVITNAGYRKQGLGEALYRELGAHLQAKGVKVLGGITVGAGPRNIRERVFGEPIREKKLLTAPGYDFRESYSAIRPDAKFEPIGEAGAPKGEETKAQKAWAEKGTDSPYFKKWFKGSKVVDENGDPLLVYHGTTHTFDTFQEHRGNPENFFGVGHYFTTSEADATDNYMRHGPDLRNRIGQRVDEIMNDSPENAISEEEAQLQARNELVGDTDKTIPAYINLKNPAVFDRKGGTTFDINFDEETGQESGNGIDLYHAIMDQAEHFGIDGQEVWNLATQNSAEITAQDFSNAVRTLRGYPEDQKGRLVPGEYIKRVMQSLGYDGIIQKDVARQFPNMNIDEGTQHVIAFKPEQVKGTENVGTFSPKDPRFAYEPLPHSVGKEAMDLVHLSDTSRTEIDPKYFGKGKATPTDLRGANKSYWFVKGSNLATDEKLFGKGGLNKHTATVSGHNIYDLREGKPDPLNYLGTINREEADLNLQAAGYRGLVIDTADGRQVAVLYDKQKVKEAGPFTGSRAEPGQSVNTKDTAKDILKGLTPGEGFTYNPYKQEHIKSGFAVSIYPDRSDIIDAKDLTPERLEKFVEANKDLLTRAENSVGGWYDKDSGKVYLDVSFTTPSRELAEFAGKAYNQKAIGDLAKYAAKENGDIPTGGTGEPLPEMLPAHKRVDDLLQDFDWERPASEGAEAEQSLMPGLGNRAPLSSKDIGDMSRAELQRHFPEAQLPKRRKDTVNYDIADAPRWKGKTDDEATNLAADELEKFAKERIHTAEFQDGLKWYSEFVPMLKKVYGKLHVTMAQLLAATSPRNSPTPNFALSNDAIEGYKAGRFDKQIAKYLDGVKMIDGDKWQSWYKKQQKAGKLVKPRDNPTPEAFMAEWIDAHNLEPRQSNGKLYGMHSVPVLQVLAGNWLTENTGPKTHQFVKNLLGTHNGATIDVWAARTMRRLGYEGLKDKWRIVPGNETGVQDADFHFSQRAFEKAAKRLGVTPDGLQGALWFAEKKLWAERGWGRLDLGDFRKEIAKVNMLNQGIAQRLAQSSAKAPAQAQSGLFDLVSPNPSRQ